MAKLKARYAIRDEIPEALREFFVENSGAFIPDLEMVEGWGIDNVDKLKTQLSKFEAKLTAQQKHLDLVRNEDGTIPDLQELMDSAGKTTTLEEQLEELRKSGGEKEEQVQERITAAVNDAKKALKRELDKSNKQTDTLRNGYRAALKSAAADSALAEARPLERFRKFLRAELLNRLDIAEEGDSFDVRVRSADGSYLRSREAGNDSYMGAVELAKGDLRTQHQDLFEGDNLGGAGVTPSPTRQPQSTDGRITISDTDADDFAKYEAAQAAAEKAGHGVVEVVD